MVFGFFRSRSREVVPLKECLLLHESLDGVQGAVQSIVSSFPSRFAGLSHLDLSADYAGRRVNLTLHSSAGPMDFPRDLLARLAAPDGEGGPEIDAGPEAALPLSLGPGETALRASGGAFTQVNLAQNGHLVGTVMELLDPSPGDRVLDLYCGIGNFSIPAALSGAEVLGVDLSAPAVASARANADRLSAGGAAFLQGRAVEAARSLASEGRSFDAVVLNPPRTGCRDTVEDLDSLGPARIVMVSCDPATFSRDAALLARRGYRLASLRALDLFPQTFHFETVGLFES